MKKEDLYLTAQEYNQIVLACINYTIYEGEDRQRKMHPKDIEHRMVDCVKVVGATLEHLMYRSKTGGPE